MNSYEVSKYGNGNNNYESLASAKALIDRTKKLIIEGTIITDATVTTDISFVNNRNNCSG